jgi:hypothetical protein
VDPALPLEATIGVEFEVPYVDMERRDDPHCCHDSPPVPEAVSAGLGTNCEFVHDLIASAIAANPSSPSQVMPVADLGHVIASLPGPRQAAIEARLADILASSPRARSCRMAIERWQPSRTCTRQELALPRRLRRTKELFALRRDHRHEIFNDVFNARLASLYRDTGTGKEPVMPALLVMAALLRSSDAETVELTVVDLRWQLVLDRLGRDEPAFAQGAFPASRERLVRTDMDRRPRRRSRWTPDPRPVVAWFDESLFSAV